MKRVLVIVVLLISGFNAIKAGDFDSLRPKFNYAILRELKNVGELNALKQRTGPWIEYVADSGEWKAAIDTRDKGKNLYPPHPIIIIKCVGAYVDGKKNGLWTYYRTYDCVHPLKWDLMETWDNLMGQPDGLHKAYYSTGQLMEEYQFKSGKENGDYRSYTREGKVTEIITYINGKAEGRSERYASNGVLIWSGVLHEGFYHGVVKEFYPNGQLRSSIEYRDGRRWNISEVYSRYGAALDKGTLENGTGVCFGYDEGGSRIESTELLDGKAHGTFRTYFLNGNVEVECDYRNDTMRGVYRAFYPEGGIRYLKSIFNGIVDGPLIEYYKSGKLKSENIYRKGNIWAAVYANDAQGNKVDCGNLKMGSGILISYDDTGRVLRKERYVVGFIEGMCEYFHSNGKIASTVSYFAGLVHGEYRSYDEGGNLTYVYNYNEGMVDGPATHYHSNGMIYEELYFYRDRLWELISIRDSSGKKLNRAAFKNGSGKVNGYYPGGALYSVKQVVHGYSHGNATVYYEDGKKFGEYQYYEDSLWGTHREYWENGVVAAEWSTNEQGRNGKFTQYHSNKKLWTVWEYENSLLLSVEFNYDSKGQPHNVGTFSKGSGSVLRYNEQDSVIFECQFLNGRCLNCEGDTINLISQD